MKQYEYSGGRVRRGKAIYVPRKEDSVIYNHLKNDFDLITLTAPRQCGKTSMAYGIGELLAEKDNFEFVFVDFRLFSHPPDEQGKSDDGVWWFRSIFKTIAKDLKIDADATDTWMEENKRQKISFTEQFANFIRDFIRKTKDNPIVIVFDELDKLGELGYYTDNFLDGLQLIFNERSQLKISFLLAAITPPSLLLKGVILSDFKTGIFFQLPDFASEENTIREWTQGLIISDEEIRYQVSKEILTQTGGHPYLSSFLMHRFNESNGQAVSDIQPIIGDLILNALNPLTGLPHFKAPRDFIVDRERYAFAAIDEYRKVIKSPVDSRAIDEKVLAVLYTTGLIKLVENHYLDVRNPIYRRIFNEEWCKKTEDGLGKRDWYSPLVIPSYSIKEKAAICLFNTGGTVGMVEHNNKMVAPHSEREFFEIYPGLRNIANIDIVQFEAKDGANIFPEDWSRIAKAIYQRRNDGYDGFVIAHGTDTMTYTASAVAFSLGAGLNMPVVFVGAQAPHNVPHGDAMVNLSRACMIASKRIPEVVISFGDEVYRAVRAQKYNDYLFHGFHSPTFKPLAIITEEIEIQKDSLWVDEKGKMECKNEFDDRVLQISQYPGFDPAWLDVLIEAGNIKGIIIESLGIGNLPTLSHSKYNLLPVIEKAIKDHQIPVIITSRYPINPEFTEKYIPATEPLKRGAISAGNMTSSAALTKLMWLLPQIEKDIKNGDIKEQYKLEEIRKLMVHSYVGEVDKMRCNNFYFLNYLTQTKKNGNNNP